jgi:hypothetical protein
VFIIVATQFTSNSAIQVPAGAILYLSGTAATGSSDFQLNGPITGSGTVTIPSYASINAGATGMPTCTNSDTQLTHSRDKF